jgi:hypothetical protein
LKHQELKNLGGKYESENQKAYLRYFLKEHVINTIPENPYNFILQLFIPLITLISSIVPIFLLRYWSLKDKNLYISILKKQYPSVKTCFDKIDNLKTISQLLSICGFSAGMFSGIIIGTLMYQTLFQIYIYLFDLNPNTLLPYSTLLDTAMLIDAWSNITIVITVVIYLLWSRRIRHKIALDLRLTDSGMIKNSFWITPISLWIFVGAIVGGNFVNCSNVIYHLHSFLISKVDFSFTLYYFENAITFMNVYIPNFNILMLIYVIVWTFSFIFIFLLYCLSTSITNELIESIKKFHKYEFPYARIKTDSGEVKGQLKDIHNKSLVTLNEKNVLSIVPWNKIETMEVININKNEYIVFDHGSIKNR